MNTTCNEATAPAQHMNLHSMANSMEGRRREESHTKRQHAGCLHRSYQRHRNERLLSYQYATLLSINHAIFTLTILPNLSLDLLPRHVSGRHIGSLPPAQRTTLMAFYGTYHQNEYYQLIHVLACPPFCGVPLSSGGI